MRTVAVVTGSRADFGIYRPILRAIEATEGLSHKIIACGTHLSPEFGNTVDEIEAAGFFVARRIKTYAGSTGPEDIAASIAGTISGFATAFVQERPDIVLVLGDRYEMFAAATTALTFALPLAHIHGGELSEGAIDDAFRHSITKMSHMHFVSTADHARRVIQLGEQPERVHVTGAPGLDNLADLDLPSRAELERTLGLALDPAPVLATFHPVTLEPGSAIRQMTEVLAALEELNRPVVFTYPNADAEGARIIAEIDRYVAGHPRTIAVPNLGVARYFALMRTAFAMVGNSSSGIIEAASFALPVVNVGDRQRGRTRGKNVLDVSPRRAEIRDALRRIADPDFRTQLVGMANPYGDGKTAPRIAAILRGTELGPGLLKKAFRDAAGVSMPAGQKSDWNYAHG